MQNFLRFKNESFSSITRKLLISSALASSIIYNNLSANAAECSNTIGTTNDECEITTTNNQDYTIDGDITRGNSDYYAVHLDGATTNSLTIEESGSIDGGALGVLVGKPFFDEGDPSTLTTLNNYGSITNNLFASVAIGPNSTITNFNNFGSLDGAEGSILNEGTIVNLVNGQVDATYYNGGYTPAGETGANKLPTNYYTYFSDSSTFGKIAFNNLINGNIDAALSYGIAKADGVNLETGTYEGVMVFDEERTEPITLLPLSGVSFQLQSDDNLTWDLIINSVTETGLYDVANSYNQTSALGAAAVIDNTPTLLDAFSSLTTDSAKASAVNHTIPVISGAGSLVVTQSLSGLNHIIQSRLSQTSSFKDNYKIDPDRRFWAQPFFTKNKQSNIGTTYGFKSKNAGLVVGADRLVKENLRLGFALGYINSDVSGHQSDARHGMKINTYQVIGYGGYKLNKNSEITFQIDGGYNEIKSNRHVAIASKTAKSKYDSFNGHAGISVNKLYSLSEKISIIPSLRADFTRVSDKGYKENGAESWNLHVNKNHRNEFITKVNGKVNYKLNQNSKIFAHLSAGYDHANKNVNITSAFQAAQDNKFRTKGLQTKPWLARGGLGIKYTPKPGIDTFAAYDAELRKKYNSQTISAVVRIKF